MEVHLVSTKGSVHSSNNVMSQRDHDNCLESVILKGKTPEVQAFAEEIISQPGVRYGRLGAVYRLISEAIRITY